MSKHNRERRQSGRLPKGLACLSCGNPFDVAVNSSGKLEKETVIVCGSCGDMHRIEDNGALRKATSGEQFSAHMIGGEHVESTLGELHKAEESERRHLLQHNRLTIEEYHRKAVNDGCAKPVVKVLNMSFGLSRKIAEAVLGVETVKQKLLEFPEDSIPTMFLAMPFEEVETPLKEMMSPRMFGKLQELDKGPESVIAVVLSGNGTLLASWQLNTD